MLSKIVIAVSGDFQVGPLIQLVVRVEVGLPPARPLGRGEKGISQF